MLSVLDSSRKSALFVAPAQLTSRVIGSVVAVIIARRLTVEDYGVYSLFFGSVLVFNFFTNLGLAGSLQRFLAEYARFGKVGPLLRTFFFSISYRAASSVVVFTVAVLLFDRLSGLFKVSEYRFEFVLFCLATAALFQIDFLQVVFNSLFLHMYSALGQLAYLSLRLALIAIALLALHGGLVGIYASELASYGLGAILFWFIFFRKAYSPRKEKYLMDRNGIEWKRFLRFSAINAATMPGGFFFSYALDYFVVAAMATTGQLGIYALGSRASKMLLTVMPHGILQTVIRPAFFHRYCSVEEKNAELNRMFRSLVVLNAAVLFPCLVLVGVQAKVILTFVFKAKFAESTPVFIMLLAFNTFTIFELSSDLVLQAIEKVQARLYAQAFAVYNVVAAVLLMPRFGVMGVAFATGSALMGKCLFFCFMAYHYTGISICWGPLLRVAFNAAIAGGSTLAVGRLGDSPLTMFASLAIGAVVYVTMCLANNFMNNREKDLVNQFCKRRIFAV